MKILHADDEKDILEIVAFAIEGKLGLDVLSTNNAMDAISKLTPAQIQEEKIKLVLSDFDMPGATGDLIYNHIKEHNLNLPFVLLSSHGIEDLKSFSTLMEDDPRNGHLRKPFSLESLISTVSASLDPNIVKKAQDNPYCKVHLHRFYSFDKVGCDVYMKISNKKYVKILKREDIKEQDILRKYEKKGVEYLYVEKEEFSELSNKYLVLITKNLKSKKQPLRKVIHYQFEGHAFINDKIQALGLDVPTIDTLSTIAATSVDALKKEIKIQALLQAIMNNRGYQYEHTLMIGYISGAIAMKIGWGNPQNLKILMYAALLHDLLLQNPTLVEEHDKNPELILSMTKNPKFQKTILEHPQKAVDLLGDCPSIPNGTKQIILEHHENPKGTGYPSKLSNIRINPLSALFIVTEYFVSSIHDKNLEEIDFEELQSHMKEKFYSGQYKKPLKGMFDFIKGF